MALTTTATEVIRPVVRAGFTEAVYRNNQLIPIFLGSQGGGPIDSGGDTARRWKINSAGNDSVATYSEGDAAPSSGEQTWVSAAVSYTHFWGMVEITGHARAALRSNYVDAVSEEFALAQKDMVDLITTTYITELATAVDSTTAYAGITRGSASYFESAETAVSGLLAETDLEDLMETLMDNDVGAMPGGMQWFMPFNQATNIYRLTGGPATQFIGDADKAPGFLGQSFAGRPMHSIGDMTDTVIYLLDLSMGKWEVVEHQGFDLIDQGRSGDADLYMITYRGQLVCTDPKTQGKLTGVTA